MKSKQILILAAGLVLSAIITFMTVSNSTVKTYVTAFIKEDSIITQKVDGVLNTTIEIVKIYDSGKLIGVVTDYKKIESLLNEVYYASYQSKFPDAEMGLGENIYISKEITNLDYENVDPQICDYLNKNNLFAIKTNAIEFSDDKGVYATIYVRDIEDFYNARDRYLLNFISQTTLDLLAIKKQTPELKTYGSRELSIEILEEMTVTTALAAPNNIMTSMEEVFSYFCYGDDPTPKIYTVVEYDMIDGIGSKNGLSVQQLVTLNPGVLSLTDELVPPGLELNVRYFESPISVVVVTESISKEIVYPEGTIYTEDKTLREGLERVIQEEENGSENVKRQETWINGIYYKSEIISRIETKKPVRREVLYGTKYVEGIGTGKFRWPVDYPRISCRWGCYAGHQAVDIQNAYNRYGNLYAADHGTIKVNSWHPINGYYMVIDHGNGYTSYYGHMNKPGFFNVGMKVEKGTVIGQIGMTGKASGPHVHFFIEYYGVRKNPCNGYLNC